MNQMSRLKKRICCCLLMITLMLTSVPIQCQAQDGYIKKNINVEYSDSQGKISSLSILSPVASEIYFAVIFVAQRLCLQSIPQYAMQNCVMSSFLVSWAMIATSIYYSLPSVYVIYE